MFNLFRRPAARAWFPGQTLICDRWGDPQNRTLTTPEFAPKQKDPREVLSQMRWGLGLM